jgi:hypothetical protein
MQLKNKIILFLILLMILINYEIDIIKHILPTNE